MCQCIKWLSNILFGLISFHRNLEFLSADNIFPFSLEDSIEVCNRLLKKKKMSQVIAVTKYREIKCKLKGAKLISWANDRTSRAFGCVSTNVHRWFARPLLKRQLLPLLDERPPCRSVSCVIAQQLDWIADFNVSRGGPTAAFTFTRINNDVARAKSIKSISGANQGARRDQGRNDDSKPPVCPVCVCVWVCVPTCLRNARLSEIIVGQFK